MERKVVCLLMIFLIFLTGCSKQVLLDEQDSKLLNYNFKIQNLDNIDKSLKKQRYAYSTNRDKKYVAVINYQDKNASIGQYIIDNNGTKDLTISRDCQFVISLGRNSTVEYSWNIKNNIDNGIIKLEKQTLIEIPPPKEPNPGENYDRQNFFFKCLKPGSEKILLRYENETQKSDQYFEITLNIKIE